MDVLNAHSSHKEDPNQQMSNCTLQWEMGKCTETQRHEAVRHEHQECPHRREHI